MPPLIGVALLALLLAAPVAAQAAPPGAGPCERLLGGATDLREELTYVIRWKLVPAGSATLRLSPAAAFGSPALRIDAEARSSSFIDVFYPVRDTSSSLATPGFGRSLWFTKSLREGSFRRDEVLEYDPLEGTGLLFRDGRLSGGLRLPDEFHDPLSGVYRFRVEPATPGDTLGMYATDGRRLARVMGTIASREHLTVPAGEFDCLKVELFPEQLEGPFVRKKSSRLFIWFTDDTCRVPVKMSTEVLIGSVDTLLERVSYTPVAD